MSRNGKAAKVTETLLQYQRRHTNSNTGGIINSMEYWQESKQFTKLFLYTIVFDFDVGVSL